MTAPLLAVGERPRLLDLFSGAGGAAVGYHRAGFDVVGVDHLLQPHYPFEFHRADALEYLAEHGGEFDVIHASPPCQLFSTIRRMRPRVKRPAFDLIPVTRAALRAIGAPYVIENVPSAPLCASIVLCGSSFGLGVRRHRAFESNVVLLRQPCAHETQPDPVGVHGDHPKSWADGSYRLNRARTLEEGQRAMGIDWMDWRELAQAIPPAYTEYLGRQLAAVCAALREGAAS